MKKTGIILTVTAIAIICLYILGTYSYVKQYDSQTESVLAQVMAQYDKKLEIIDNVTVVMEPVLTTAGQKEMIGNLQTAVGVYKSATKAHDKIVGAKLVDGALGQIRTEVNKNALLGQSKNMQAIGAELNSLEQKTEAIRGEYNLSVQKYNTVIKQVPGSLLAPLFGFVIRDYFYDSTPAIMSK